MRYLVCLQRVASKSLNERIDGVCDRIDRDISKTHGRIDDVRNEYVPEKYFQRLETEFHGLRDELRQYNRNLLELLKGMNHGGRP